MYVRIAEGVKPPRVLSSLQASLVDAKTVHLGLVQDVNNENALTDLVFFRLHPERQGRLISPHEAQLAQEWLNIRNHMVRPTLARYSSSQRSGRQLAPTFRETNFVAGLSQYRSGALAGLGSIAPEDVNREMFGKVFEVTKPFTAGSIQLSGGERVTVLLWFNARTTAQVLFLQIAPPPAPSAPVLLNIPKRLLQPVATKIPGMAPYSAGLAQVGRSIARLNCRLIQETMFNHFDPLIQKWTDHYNQNFQFSGAQALDPNLVKSMMFQESQMGTSGPFMVDPPPHPLKRNTRFNLIQVVDSSGPALLIMMQEMQPSLITAFHLQNIRTDLANAQRELGALKRLSSRNAAQQARLDELRRLSAGSWETFFWEYRASGQTRGFSEAVLDFFTNVPTGQSARNLDYEFWIRTAIRWLFEKRKGVKSWAEAIRAYNGTGASAERYRDRVIRRAQEAKVALKAGKKYIPCYPPEICRDRDKNGKPITQARCV